MKQSITARHVAELERENAKLREQLADAPKCEACEAMLDCDECLRADSSQKERKRLDYENAKLRELVRDVNKAAHMLCEAWEGSCNKEAEGMSLHAVCPISDTNELCVFGKLYDRMRELGIEVDE